MWTTPQAYIYATHASSAGELDRLAIQIKKRYVADVHGPTPRPLIVVRDANEPLPTIDPDALLHHAIRFSVQRESGSKEHAEQSQAGVDGVMMGLKMSAVACGTDVDALTSMMPMLCDDACLRSLRVAPDGAMDDIDLVIILPTRTRLRQSADRIVHDALKQYGIGPLAQFLLAPVIALAKAQMVEKVALLREAAVYDYWLFRHPDLPENEKRRLAAVYLERWGGEVEAGAAIVAEAATATAGAINHGPSK